MLYETLGQPLVFLCMLGGGCAAGVLFDGAKFLTKLCKDNKILSHTLFFVATLCAGAIFYLVNLAVNFGQFRFYTIDSFICAIILEQISVGKLFAKLANKCYNRYHGRGKKEKNS